MDNKLTIKTYLQFISIKNYFHAQFVFSEKKVINSYKDILNCNKTTYTDDRIFHLKNGNEIAISIF